MRWLDVLVLFLLVSFGGSGGILGFVILVLFLLVSEAVSWHLKAIY